MADEVFGAEQMASPFGFSGWNGNQRKTGQKAENGEERFG